jgi:hypothetical protein
MQDSHDVPPTTGPGYTAAPWWRHRWTSVSALIVAVGLLLTACGSSESIATLDTGKIERAIAQSSLAQRDQRARVSCPSEVPQIEGLKFSCSAVVGAVSTRFVVVEQDEFGHVRYEAP